MCELGFFPRLALVNLARNRRFYGPYLLSCGGVAALYYVLRYLTWSETLSAVRGAHPYEEPVINVLPLAATGLVTAETQGELQGERER